MKKILTILFILFSIFLHNNICIAQDENDGIAVAAALNERYNNVVTECDGKPGYYCSGIIIRTNEKSWGGGLTWVPSLNTDSDYNSFSFSFIRKDIGKLDKKIWGFSDSGFGILLDTKANATYSVRCIFPVNAASVDRDQHGCGQSNSLKIEEEDNSTCAAMGITTAEQWIEQGISNGTDCSFSAQMVSPFNEALRAQELLDVQYNEPGWNELLINTSTDFWNVEDPSKDNIVALWYNKSLNDTGLDGAQNEQQEYYKLTSKWVPIIAIDSAAANEPFIYSADDQVVKP